MDNLRFFLNFKNDNTGLVEISELVKFDNANFVIEQDSKRYGRDVIFGNEEENLEFYAGIYENGLTHEFENLIRYYNDFGFESEVEFILQRDNVDFTIGVLDFETAETDQIEYFKCKVIQQTTQALVKRREDVKVDVFSDKDLDDNTITPVQTSNILLKSKPVLQVSSWSSKSIDNSVQIAGNAFSCQLRIPLVNGLTKFGIENSYVPFDQYNTQFDVSSQDIINYYNSNYIVQAVNNLTNLTVKIKNLSFLASINIGDIQVKSIIFSGDNPSNYTIYQNINLATDNNTNVLALDNQDYTYTIQSIPSGYKLCVELVLYGAASSLFGYNFYVNNFSCDGVEIVGTSTAVDSVIKGVRHIDYIKQCYKSASGLNVVAPFYDNGSEHYNNFVFNGKLIRQIKDEAFYGTIKENNEHLKELNSDFQINKNNVYIGNYNQIYSNNEAGAFLTTPDDSFKTSVNGRYALQTMEYKYNSFEQDKDSDNTTDAVHTSTQWLFSNKQVEGNLVIGVPFVRDAFEIEFTRRNNINVKDTTSLSNDDKVYIIDVVELAPNSRNKFTKFLTIQENGSQLKILSDGTFNWTLLGFNVGDIVKINGTNRTVLDIDNSVITATYGGGGSTINTSIEFDYPLTNVQYVNRTNQGFTQIENIFSGDNFSNLRYTIKRNLDYFLPYLKTVLKYNNGKLKNTYFKSNGEATTQYMNGEIYVENADILKVDMQDAILTPLIYSTTLVADFEDVYNLLVAMQTINADNSIGGFIRIMDNNGRVVKVYPKKLDYTWATAELKIDGEEKQESEFLTIEKVGSLIYINEVGYDETIIGNIEVRTKGEYIQLLDNRGVGLINYTKFDKISINSNIFSTFEETIEAILTL